MDMQGSKIAITLPTGQVVEYELMRIGTVREYRELVKAHETITDDWEKECLQLNAKLAAERELCTTAERSLAEMTSQSTDNAKTAAMAVEGAAGARDAALAGVDEIARQRDETRAELAALIERTQKTEDARAEKTERQWSLAQKIEADKVALEKLLAEILGAVDQLNED